MHAVPRSAGSPRTSQHDSALRRQSSSHPAICATRLPRQSRAPTNTTIHRRYLTAATSLLSPPPSGPPSQLPSADSDLPHPSDTSSPRLASPPPPLPHSTCHFRVRYRLVLACQGGEDTTTPGERREGGSIANTPKSLPTEQAPPPRIYLRRKTGENARDPPPATSSTHLPPNGPPFALLTREKKGKRVKKRKTDHPALFPPVPGRHAPIFPSRSFSTSFPPSPSIFTPVSVSCPPPGNPPKGKKPRRKTALPS